jgi:hypothetical protein
MSKSMRRTVLGAIFQACSSVGQAAIYWFHLLCELKVEKTLDMWIEGEETGYALEQALVKPITTEQTSSLPY